MMRILYICAGVAVFIWFFISLSVIGHAARFFYSESSCVPAMSNNEWVKNIGSAIRKLSDDKERFLLKDLTPFEWDRFVVFTPYTLDTKLIAEVGFRPRLLGCTGIYLRDDINLLVFTKGSELMAFADASRATQWQGVRRGAPVDSRNSWFCIQKQGHSILLKTCGAENPLNDGGNKGSWSPPGDRPGAAK